MWRINQDFFSKRHLWSVQTTAQGVSGVFVFEAQLKPEDNKLIHKQEEVTSEDSLRHICSESANGVSSRDTLTIFNTDNYLIKSRKSPNEETANGFKSKSNLQKSPTICLLHVFDKLKLGGRGFRLDYPA